MKTADRDIARFIESLPRTMTYSDIEDACRERFGDRAWSREKIMSYWMTMHPPKQRNRFKAEENPRVAVFIEERAGRLTLNELLTDCRREFGAAAPSRSSIQRYVKAVERRLLPNALICHELTFCSSLEQWESWLERARQMPKNIIGRADAIEEAEKMVEQLRGKAGRSEES
jgi:hypothetical protein